MKLKTKSDFKYIQLNQSCKCSLNERMDNRIKQKLFKLM